MRPKKHRAMGLAALLLAGAVAACGGDGDSDAFTFTDDELCDWITTDEVAGFYASVYEWDGTAELVNTEDAGPDECWWRLTSPTENGYVEVSAGNADPGFLLPYEEVAEYDGEPVPDPGGAVSGHPALSEGVVVQSAGWGAYSFWVPPRDEYLSLLANRVSGDSPGTRVVGVGDQDRFFAFADQLLQELGWVS